MLDNELDRAIDEATRAMTAGEPGSDLRARVLARIDTPRRAWNIWIPAFAAAAMIVALVVAISVRSVRLQPEPPSTPTVALKPDVTYTPHTSTPQVATTDTPGPKTRPPSPPSIAPPAFEDETPSIDIPRIAVDALAPDASLDLQPLDTIAPIAITPIDAEGDRK